jgi:predicted aspartyl protease
MNYMQFLQRILLFLFLSFVGVQVPAQAATVSSLSNIVKSSDYHAFPITVNDGFLMVPAAINKKKVWAIIDTGSKVVGATQGMAKLLHATAHSFVPRAVDMNGGVSSSRVLTLPRVVIAGVSLGTIRAGIYQQVNINPPALVVGRHFLQQHHAIIDTYHHVLYLADKRLSLMALNTIKASLAAKGLLPVPLLSTATGEWVLPLQIDNAMASGFLFDTGTGVTLLSQHYAKNLKLSSKTQKAIVLKRVVLNPLNSSFQHEIVIKSVPIELAKLTVLRQYLYLQGIFGLPDMVKAHAVILIGQGLVFFQARRPSSAAREMR